MMTAIERDAEIASFQARYKSAHGRLWGQVPRSMLYRPKAKTSPSNITFSDWLRLDDFSKAKAEPVNPIPLAVAAEPVDASPPPPTHVPFEAAAAMAAKMAQHDAPLRFMRVSVPAIIAVVAAYFNITPEHIMSCSRQDHIVLPRHIAMCFAHELTQLSTLHISKLMYRDHATLLHAYKKIAWRIAHEPATAAAVDELRAILTAPRAPTMAEIFAEAAVCESAD
jgi:hypothetical protein